RCSYHAWRFDSSGACINIPQCPPEQAELAKKMACATVYPTKVR
ncbi:unnamed protein product, partial [Discosporangium mesarthrocarpum]